MVLAESRFGGLSYVQLPPPLHVRDKLTIDRLRKLGLTAALI